MLRFFCAFAKHSISCFLQYLRKKYWHVFLTKTGGVSLEMSPDLAIDLQKVPFLGHFCKPNALENSHSDLLCFM